MDIYSLKNRWKILIFLASVTIGAGSLWYTGRLVKNLSREEMRKVELWAEATRLFAANVTDRNTDDLNFIFKVLENNTTIPVILTDEDYHIIYYRNFDSTKVAKPDYLLHQLSEMRESDKFITILLNHHRKNYIYYRESVLLQKLSIYPYIQLSVIIIFVLVSYLAFSSSRKAEQNKVWVGLSRETAHQLGTPLSSLMAWVEILKDRNAQDHFVAELEKDVQRLQIITERFSKIGAMPDLQIRNVNGVIGQVVDYMTNRIPSTAKIHLSSPVPVYAPVNIPLFGWVIENLIKNALDAISNQGKIEILISANRGKVLIDVTDNGKGILRKNIHQVFKPGFTTKARGWGLGLSLVRRIVEDYHKGKIGILQTEINKGTTFRITLPGA